MARQLALVEEEKAAANAALEEKILEMQEKDLLLAHYQRMLGKSGSP